MGKFDEILDDVLVNAKAAASAVSKKASSVYDTSKHKITAAELRGEINKKLKDLGALTYKAQIQDVDLSEDIATLVSEITDLKDSLAVINEHIANTKNQRKCSKCDAIVPKNSLYCNICGAKIEENETAETESKSEEGAEPTAEVQSETTDETQSQTTDEVAE